MPNRTRILLLTTRMQKTLRTPEKPSKEKFLVETTTVIELKETTAHANLEIF